jgi:signal transduction histidine kinase
MKSELNISRQLSDQHKVQRDSARTERDSALEERDSARTERDDFKDQADDLERNKVAQEQFIATLSHDLRNPIGAIKMASEIIRDGADKEVIREMTNLIERNADQAGELISQLLDAHLIRSGATLPIRIKRCDLLWILQKCHQSLEPGNQSKILLKSESGSEVWGVWDPHILERAFRNLISNAIKFSDSDKNIFITVSQGPEITNIRFQNFGELISLENQLRIFDSQFRVLQKELHQKKGWGLGLTLVRGIAEAHGGKIEVSSSRSEGTTFTLSLPNNAGPPRF